ncbi:MAG: PssD/Cps14F family polysaccharide biosynthesis glycosyltransferase [Pseudonocardiaceae bacterium]
MLVASTGGHLAQLLNLAECWSGYERHWVTFDKPDAVVALQNEVTTWAHHPTTRNIPNAMRNFLLAARTLRRVKPHLVVSTGAGVALPFFLMAKLCRIRTVYIEVFDRIDRPTLTGRLCYPLSDAFCLQWEDQRSSYPDGVYVGPAW